MYSVQELSKIYKCTRGTIYSKLEHPDIQQYKQQTDKGLRLLPEGLNVLNIIMADSKVNKVEQEQDTKQTVENNVQMIDINLYVEQLNKQIAELKVDKENLNKQVESLTEALSTSQELNKNSQLLLNQSQQRILFLETSNQDIEKNKRMWWKRFFS